MANLTSRYMKNVCILCSQEIPEFHQYFKDQMPSRSVDMTTCVGCGYRIAKMYIQYRSIGGKRTHEEFYKRFLDATLERRRENGKLDKPISEYTLQDLPE